MSTRWTTGLAPRRRSRGVGLCAGLLLVAAPHPASTASSEDCRAFHAQCADARAAGYDDVGICNVERLECSLGDEASPRKPPPAARRKEARDPECTPGERSVGP